MKQPSTVSLALALIFVGVGVNAQKKDDFYRRIDSLLQTTDVRKFNGVVLITQNGNVKYAKASGYADYEKKTPISLKDNFRIQSNTKQITAVLVLKEVEKGSLNLDVPIRKYVPDFPRTWADSVTVHQLMNMSSGVTGLDKPLAFTPGSGFIYSNPAYGLLGQILEKVTGEKYATLANNLFRKLGMKNTSCHEIGKQDNGLVTGHTVDKDAFTRLEFGTLGFTKESWEQFLPAGGIISNAHDLSIWDSKLHNGQILQPTSYEAMVNSDVVDMDDTFSDEASNYGYGVNINETDPVKYVGHAGRGIGFVSLKFYVPEKKLDVIILENVYNNNFNAIYHFERELRKIVMSSSLVKVQL